MKLKFICNLKMTFLAHFSKERNNFFICTLITIFEVFKKVNDFMIELKSNKKNFPSLNCVAGNSTAGFYQPNVQFQHRICKSATPLHNRINLELLKHIFSTYHFEKMFFFYEQPL